MRKLVVSEISRRKIKNHERKICMKTCFVIMGFGKKFDYKNCRTVNLDDVYNRVIKKVFEMKSQEYKLIRADEIISSTLIDINMYNLLMNAELVIADLTTYNPNALYELGIRHALKPFSTILMIDDKSDLVFDLNHSNTLKYPEIREYLDQDKVNETIQKLSELVDSCLTPQIDSPFYSYLPKVVPPKIQHDIEEELKKRLESQSENIADLLIDAKRKMECSDFHNSFLSWEKMNKILPNNDFFIQQMALSKYKSKYPSETVALMNAYSIINNLVPENSLDPETLGIAGAINKKLYIINKNIEYLEAAIILYKRGYVVKNDYYNGENYVNCLLLKIRDSSLKDDEKTYYTFEAMQATNQLIQIIQELIDRDEQNYWVYSTLAACYFLKNEMLEYKKFEELFYSNVRADWEKETYMETLKLRKEVCK
ncbi:MAG: hypothetical protein FD133_1658 [Erysipelotrichaceae bacterium]|nr:MAG: hypothetical protein FD133_1658 [Erysipelotrichaceae bacterium]